MHGLGQNTNTRNATLHDMARPCNMECREALAQKARMPFGHAYHALLLWASLGTRSIGYFGLGARRSRPSFIGARTVAVEFGFAVKRVGVGTPIVGKHPSMNQLFFRVQRHGMQRRRERTITLPRNFPRSRRYCPQRIGKRPPQALHPEGATQGPIFRWDEEQRRETPRSIFLETPGLARASSFGVKHDV